MKKKAGTPGATSSTSKPPPKATNTGGGKSSKGPVNVDDELEALKRKMAQQKKK